MRKSIITAIFRYLCIIALVVIIVSYPPLEGTAQKIQDKEAPTQQVEVVDSIHVISQEGKQLSRSLVEKQKKGSRLIKTLEKESRREPEIREILVVDTIYVKKQNFFEKIFGRKKNN